jgi:hypothetical protein
LPKLYGINNGVSKKEHERYQHARLIAFYDTNLAPSLPEEPGKN